MSVNYDWRSVFLFFGTGSLVKLRVRVRVKLRVRFRCQRIIYSSLLTGETCKYGCRLPADDTGRYNNNTTIFIIVLSSTAQNHMREMTSGLLSKSRPAPSGRQLVGQAANLSSPVGCYRLDIYRLPFVILLSHGADSHFTVPRRLEG